MGERLRYNLVNILSRTCLRFNAQLDYLVQAKQAQFSLYEAESAGRLNNYIMIFTVVTVVFASLVSPPRPSQSS